MSWELQALPNHQGVLGPHRPWPVPTGGFQMWLEIGLDSKVLVLRGLQAVSGRALVRTVAQRAWAPRGRV